MFLTRKQYSKSSEFIYKKHINEFYNYNKVLDANKLSDFMMFISPFMFSFNIEKNMNKRHYLYNITMNIRNNENINNLVCIGNGCIDDNSIMIIGMAPGFNNGNEIDSLSRPFKPSLFFSNTARILRLGLYEHINKIYFTNLSKITQDKENMNKNYFKYFDKYYDILLKEIEIINPAKIICIGKDVFYYLNTKNINKEIYSFYHPSFFIYRHQEQDGILYYNKEIKRINK